MRKALAVLAALAAAGCGGGGSGSGNPTPAVVATPVISPAGGTFTNTQAATITCATAGATIRYTTDGTTPTGSSPAYAAAIPVSATGTTIRAFAQAAGQTDSAVASATFVLQVAPVTATPAAGTYATAQSVTLSTVTSGAAIHYTTDGTAPSAASPTYSAPIAVPATATIRALATRAGFADGAALSALYTIDAGATPAATPTFSPAGGSYATAQSVTISTTTPGATIRYTTDGSDPTGASTVYAGPVQVAATTTLKAVATAPGFTQSAVGQAVYTITLTPTATPAFSPPPGTYGSAQSVTITCATAGATIYYTTNGADPTTGSAVYSSPVPVSSGTVTIKAMATSAGHTQSAVATGVYTISTGTTFAAACAQVTTAQRNLIASCQKVNSAVFGAPGPQSFDFCASTQKEIDAGRITFDATQGAACVAALPSLTCADVSQGGGSNLPAACDAAIQGNVANGGACYAGDGCQSTFCTADRSLTCPGTCQPLAQLNQSCFSAPCAAGLACDVTGGGTCKTASAAGGACPCVDAAWCDTSAGPPGTCRAFRAAGGACATGEECAVGTFCVSGTCRALVGGGGSCSATEPCGFGWTCTGGTCVTLPSVGQACSQATSPQCIGGYCPAGTGQTCQAYKAVGAACSSFLECVTGSCSGAPGVCEQVICVAP